MRVRSVLLVLLMLTQGAAMAHASSGRAASIELSTPTQEWLSNQTVELVASISNLPFGTQLFYEWDLRDESGQVVTNGSAPFQATGTVTEVTVGMKHFYNGDTFYRSSFTVFDQSNSTIVEGTHGFVVFHNSIMPQRGNLLAFGDSLSDMGNAKNSILNVPDVPPYWQGRFSNGQVWLEYVSDAYGLQTTIGSGTNAGDNRAFGGSQTGSGFSYLLLPNVGTQITNYLTNVQSAIPNDEVVSLWAGGNDFLYGSANANIIATNMEVHIRQLANSGAEEFIIPNLPPLELTPEISGRSQSQQTAIGQEVILYNQKLASLITNLTAELGIKVHSIDAWSIFNDILQNKQSLGLTNTQDAACSGGISLLPLPICNSGDTIVPNVDEYLFFDKAHPTRVMHRFIAQFAVEAIGEGDMDGDGILDEVDACPWTEEISTRDFNGCDWSQRDDDGDGVANGIDVCPSTIEGDAVDQEGCSAVQRDTDQDGLNDAIDPCPLGDGSNDHDGDGCTDSVDADDDNDGFVDQEDACPLGALGAHEFDLDEDGCHDSEDPDIDNDEFSNQQEADAGTDPRDPDTDDDGVIDGLDDFPLDSSEWVDSDGDGCGDNRDLFVNDPTECKDTDEDGVGDNQDAFPADETEWADQDEDGFGDNSDACFLTFGTSLIPLGCPDSDGDTYADSVDAFPDDVEEWNDSDADGYGDNSDMFPLDARDWFDRDNDTYGDNSDVFPSNPNEWNDTDADSVGDNSDAFPLDPTEWNDRDGDGCGDNSDVWPDDPTECSDQDFDGVGDNADAFPTSAYEWLDSDGDGLGDNADQFPNDARAKYDSDNDGVANALDPFPNSPSLDSWFDVLLRMTFVAGLIIAGVVMWSRSQNTLQQPKWTELEASSSLEMQSLPVEATRPDGPPPSDAFTYDNQP